MKNNDAVISPGEVITAIERFAQQANTLRISTPDDFRLKWTMAGREGLPGLVVSTEYGGLGLGAKGTCLALEELGRTHEDAGFNFALAAHLLACVVPINSYCDSAESENWLSRIANGECVVANAMTEGGAGSAAYNMATVAEPVAGKYRLRGEKTYCSNGPVADLVLTYAMTNPKKGAFGGITAFVLDPEKHGFRRGPVIPKAGLTGCLLGEFAFADLIVGDEDILGSPGGGAVIFQESMNWERICLGALHLGEMTRLLKNVVTFANSRKPGGVAISKHQSVTHPLARLKARMASARALMILAAEKLDEGQPVAEEAAMVKLLVSELYRDFAVQLHQTYGGVAFHAGHPAAECLANSAASTIYSGTSEVQCNIIARYLGLR
ncbi:acyl-CoA dehydrogenase [Neolewinella aurantiaca]|uniref:Acyl-CoA dehydrogenase n=1 Tax=Neolewinella aurantiaca TaxID=2602767 RepID=A0A5C7FGP4_9BACT|nr:acyl-CoA dehydrogenase family protein [Neolewinella aurantiaca]TXF85444.1 acyl-CoA dehydrogenase [Neolewinella aurantiaca]